MASPKRFRGGIWLVALCAGLLVGALPPVLGRPGPPATVIRTQSVRLASLVPSAARVVPAENGGLRFAASTLTQRQTLCAPIPFQTVGFTWRADDLGSIAEHEPVRVDVFWGPGYRRHVPTASEPDDGPDVGSRERDNLTATLPVWIGEARCLRFRLRVPAGQTIQGLRAVFINTSGTAESPASEATAALAGIWGALSSPLASSSAQAMTSQPAIISRADWGADERMRNCGPDYADAVKMAYVHHTAGANDYRRHQADDIVRGIYAYHTETRGWCDIGYNFLVDRFGRVYEGRYGGIDQPVIGAHAMGFNTGSTGASVMGNFEVAKPTAASLDALSSLLAWRLDVAHVPPAGWTTMVSGGGSSQRFGEGQSVRLRAISGHRDTGNTACPGRWLYERLGSIRSEARNLGLPKIWKPTQTPSQVEAGGQEVTWRAKLSGPLVWTIEVRNESGLRVERFTGTGEIIQQTWDTQRQGVPIAPGTYTVTFSATDALGSAREAVFTLLVGPVPSSSPSPSPSPSPTALRPGATVPLRPRTAS